MIEQFKALMKQAGYTWFRVHRKGVFGDEVFVEEEVRDAGGWIALWGCVGTLDIGRGCGGTNYYQIKRDSLPLGDYDLIE